MNEILTKVQTDLNKLQKTLEREGEVLISKIKDAATKAASNKSVVAKRKEFEKLVETQFKKFEPALDKFYKDLKVTAERYGVNLDKIEDRVKTTTGKATGRLKKKAKEMQSKDGGSPRGASKKSQSVSRKKATKKV